MNTLLQTGSSLTSVNDRDGYTGNAISLNGDVLQSVSATKRSNYSVSFWFNTSTNDALNRYILDQYGSSVGYRFTLQDGDLKAYVSYVYYNNAARYSSGSTLTKTDVDDGLWHHAVITMQTAFTSTLNGNIPKVIYKLYVDNALIQTTELQVGTTQYGTNEFRTIEATPVSIGNSQDMSADHYTELVDDIRLYAKTLSVDEIGSIYTQRTSPITLYVDENCRRS